MSDERNIDRLFQESFKDFEVDAPKSAWVNIEKHLSQKTRKPLIPLWQKLGGVAAAVGILILIGSQWLTDPITLNNNNPIVESPLNNVDNNIPSGDYNSPIIPNIDIDEETNVSVSLNENQVKSNNGKINSANEISESISYTAKNNKTSEQRKSNSALYVSKNSNQNNNTIVSNNTIASIDKNLNDETQNSKLIFNSKSFIHSSKQPISAQPIQSSTDKTYKPEKQSLVEVAENINNNDFAEKSKSTEKSWFIKPQISPVYYGNLGGGSAVDANLSENSSQGEVNMSYGVNIAYQLNDKIKLRTGVNRVNLNYTTNDVFLVQSEGFGSLNNVNTSTNFNASILNGQQLQNLESEGILTRIPIDQSELRQELGYLEIPMELEYKLLDKKIDINLIGGASTLLLNDNNLDIKNINGTTSVGEANNLNNLSFSTNFAIGLDYDISKKFMLNIEPTFKYQFNTFQTGTTDFQPYFLAIYSGVIFKF